MPKTDDNTRMRILEAARSLFRKYGYDYVRLEDVAREARKQRTTIYLYFKNKDDLFFSIIRQEVDTIYQQLNQSIDGVETAAEQFKAFCTARFELMHERIDDFVVLSKEVLDNPYMLNQLREQHEGRQFIFIKKILEFGIANREFSPVDDTVLNELIWIFITAMRGVTVGYCTGRLKGDISQITASLCAMILCNPLLMVQSKSIAV